MKKKFIIKTTLLLLIILFIGLATAQVITNINLNLNQEDKETLLRVGEGIGTIEKVREVCINDSDCFNETYIDKLKLIPLGCDDYCYFKLYEENGINKEFKVELEQICKTEGICEDLGKSYKCCLEYRTEIDEEVLAKAEIKSKEILKHIVEVTKQREIKRTERFEEVEIEI